MEQNWSCQCHSQGGCVGARQCLYHNYSVPLSIGWKKIVACQRDSRSCSRVMIRAVGKYVQCVPHVIWATHFYSSLGRTMTWMYLIKNTENLFLSWSGLQFKSRWVRWFGNLISLWKPVQSTFLGAVSPHACCQIPWENLVFTVPDLSATNISFKWHRLFAVLCVVWLKLH